MSCHSHDLVLALAQTTKLSIGVITWSTNHQHNILWLLNCSCSTEVPQWSWSYTHQESAVFSGSPRWELRWREIDWRAGADPQPWWSRPGCPGRVPACASFRPCLRRSRWNNRWSAQDRKIVHQWIARKYRRLISCGCCGSHWFELQQLLHIKSRIRLWPRNAGIEMRTFLYPRTFPPWGPANSKWLAAGKENEHTFLTMSQTRQPNWNWVHLRWP